MIKKRPGPVPATLATSYLVALTLLDLPYERKIYNQDTGRTG